MEQQKLAKKVLSIKNLSKTYVSKDGGTKNHVIDDISFDVYENEFLVIFGPGQNGKTTLLKCLAGLEEKSEGEIRFKDNEVVGPNPALGFVYQSIALFPWLTVKDNVEFGPKVRGVKAEEIPITSQKYIDLVGLSGFENRYPSQLSGGMKQRVGIARAYANNPEILFMDEPFSALDAQTRYLMSDELQKIWQKEKRTVVFVTNNIEEAIFLADRIILLSNSPAKIKKEYKINLPHPRDYVDEEFLRLREEITNNMDKVL